MSNNFLKITCAIFVVLAAIASFPFVEKMISRDKSDSLKNLSVNLSSFDKNSVEKIIIKKGDDEKILTIKQDGWYIGSEKADDEKVSNLFDDFADLKIKQTASQNEENQSKFEVTKDAGVALIITQNGKDSSFFIGKVGSSIEDFYIRKEGIKNVYLVNGTLRDKLTWDASKWKKIEEKK